MWISLDFLITTHIPLFGKSKTSRSYCENMCKLVTNVFCEQCQAYLCFTNERNCFKHIFLPLICRNFQIFIENARLCSNNFDNLRPWGCSPLTITCKCCLFFQSNILSMLCIHQHHNCTLMFLVFQFALIYFNTRRIKIARYFEFMPNNLTQIHAEVFYVTGSAKYPLKLLTSDTSAIFFGFSFCWFDIFGGTIIRIQANIQAIIDVAMKFTKSSHA